ncbi:unnamed protein product [Urochloa humidicola]
MARIGDPSTRPEEDCYLVPTSFDLEQEVKEWEGTALVVKAMSAPASTGIREIEAVVLDELCLQRGDVRVSRHQPEPFLIKFNNKHHAEEAANMSCLRHHGIVINVRPWRSLAAALGAALFFRVRLCLEGVPVHAWNPDLVERIVGMNCSLECIETNLLHPDDTRTIDLWAWTANPSKIPKRIWLVFTNKDDNFVVHISRTPPEHWQRGTKYGVLMHLEWIYDYTATTADPFGHFGTRVQMPVPEPDKRKLLWHRGVMDGEPPLVPTFPPFNVPPPYHDRRCDRMLDLGVGHRGKAPAADRRDRAPELGADQRGKAPMTEDHQREGDGRHVRRGGRSYNNDHPRFGGSFHRRDDNDDDNGGYPRDHGWHATRLRDARFVVQEPVFRDRERSPRRHGAGGYSGGRRREASPTTDIVAGHRNISPPEPNSADSDTPSAEVLQFRFLFQLNSSLLNLSKNLPDTADNTDFLERAVQLTERLQASGGEAWSGQGACTIPLPIVFERIKSDLQMQKSIETPITVEMVEQALHNFTL